MKRASHRDFQKLKSLMALRLPARELSSSALHKAGAIGADLRLFWTQRRCDLMMTARFA
jgi:hypothetical protein